MYLISIPQIWLLPQSSVAFSPQRWKQPNQWSTNRSEVGLVYLEPQKTFSNSHCCGCVFESNRVAVFSTTRLTWHQTDLRAAGRPSAPDLFPQSVLTVIPPTCQVQTQPPLLYLRALPLLVLPWPSYICCTLYETQMCVRATTTAEIPCH